MDRARWRDRRHDRRLLRDQAAPSPVDRRRTDGQHVRGLRNPGCAGSRLRRMGGRHTQPFRRRPARNDGRDNRPCVRSVDGGPDRWRHGRGRCAVEVAMDADSGGAAAGAGGPDAFRRRFHRTGGGCARAGRSSNSEGAVGGESKNSGDLRSASGKRARHERLGDRASRMARVSRAGPRRSGSRRADRD